VFYDVSGTLSDHWIDLVVGTLVASLGWFVSDRFRAMDARHQRAEDKFEEIDKDIGKLKVRTTRLETVCRINHSQSSEDSSSAES